MTYPYYLTYDYPNCLDSYIVPDSELETPKVIVDESILDVDLDRVGLDRIMEDETFRRIRDQWELGRRWNVYSEHYPSHCQLNTVELRHDFATRIAASGHANFTVFTAPSGQFFGELIVKRATGELVMPNAMVLDILRAFR